MRLSFSMVCLTIFVGCSARTAETPPKPLPAIPGSLAIVSCGDSRYPTTSLYVAKADALQNRRNLAANAYANSIAWAPDGKRIAFINVYNMEIQIADTETGMNQSVYKSRYGARPAWSPQGDKIAIVTLDASPGILSIAGKTITRFPGCKAPCSFETWSPDGRWIALICGNGQSDLMLAEAGGGKPITLCTLRSNAAQLAWSPDGKKLVISGSPNLSVLDLDSRQIRHIVSSEGDYLFPCWSPDGKWIAFSYSDPKLIQPYLIHIMRPDGTDFRRLSKPNTGRGRYSHRDPSWSPDSKFIVFHSSRGYGDMTGISTPDNAIYIASIDGLYYENISPQQVEDLGAVWSPK